MSEEVSEHKRYRRHSAAFKAKVVAQCNTQDVSVASVARANQLGNSLVSKWIAKDRAKRKSVAPDFIELPIAPRLGSSGDTLIHIEVNQGPLRMTIDWPVSAAGTAAVWLRKVLA
jgi:transposase